MLGLLFINSSVQGNVRTYFSVKWHFETVLDDFDHQRFILYKPKMAITTSF